MPLAQRGIHLVDYQIWQLPGVKLGLRGPACDLRRPYLAFLGGTETFGRFMEAPFPHLIGARLHLPVLNLGCVNAGLDVYLRKLPILNAAHHASAAVLEIPGAHNQSNRYYSVHPWRNDRFLRPTRELVLLYPDVDFTEIIFTRHLLKVLRARSRRRFRLLREELQRVWVDRMKTLLATVGPTLLFWFARQSPGRDGRGLDVSVAPLFVTPEMIREISGDAADFVSVVPEAAEVTHGQWGLQFTALEEAAAQTQLGYEAHQRAAAALAGPITSILHTYR